MRKMATVQKIEEVVEIPEADKICAYKINGWTVVDSKHKYSVGELVVFCEIDSWMPNSIAPFLTPVDRFPKEYLGVKGEKLKTKKLRGVISQGLLLPITHEMNVEFSHTFFNFDCARYLQEGDDVSELLGIVKYDPPLPAQLTGQAKGNFPSLVPKTDQERIQGIKLEKYYGEYEVTEKLEGSSMTCYLDQDSNFEVCSRNLSLKEDQNNSFWKAALMYNIREKMLDNDLQGLAIQGELIGEGIQGNIYNLKGVDFYVYDIYDTKQGKYLSSKERVDICAKLGLKHVPILDTYFISGELGTKTHLLVMAEDFSKLNPKQQREGVVFKNLDDPSKSFKIVSNRYLLKQKD